MKFVKKFEAWDDEKSKSLLNVLKDFSGQMDRLKLLVKHDTRVKTPKEIYEDYFLEFKEVEGFHIIINKDVVVGPVRVSLYNMIDINIIENEFYRFVNKFKSVQMRLENDFSFDCLFNIKLNGKPQADLNTKTHKNDDYKFKGLGDRKFGYDGKGNCYNTDNSSSYSGSLKFPDNKVSMIVDFYII